MDHGGHTIIFNLCLTAARVNRVYTKVVEVEAVELASIPLSHREIVRGALPDHVAQALVVQWHHSASPPTTTIKPS